jgi:hypothetical protein
MGSPFTTLAVTQNYHSHLHCEPEEHPFSFITWLDVLSAGTKIEVRAESAWQCCACRLLQGTGSASLPIIVEQLHVETPQNATHIRCFSFCVATWTDGSFTRTRYASATARQCLISISVGKGAVTIQVLPRCVPHCCPGGCSLQVGHFWLTHALAFAPRHGSALHIDVRLVTHCSDTCAVRGAQSDLEGRYGEALLRGHSMGMEPMRESTKVVQYVCATQAGSSCHMAALL